MLILSFILVFFSVFVSGLFMIVNISSSFEEEIGERSMAIARTISQMEDVKYHVGQDGGSEYIQPVAERIRLSTNVDYVVILDMNGIRYSHPSTSRIGQKFAGGDETKAYTEQEYISKAEGDLGYAIRAFVPIMDHDNVHQIGVAVVGILAPTFQTLLMEYQSDLWLSLFWGLLFGLIGAWFLANNVKKQTYQLEPYEISRLVEERSTIMETLDIGIIATDETGKVTFVNELAQHYIKINAWNDLTIDQIFTQTWIIEGDQHDQIVHRPLRILQTMYLLSIYPIFVKEVYAGDLITLKSRSEARQLGEELTGVKSLVAALRAQNHEHMNKMHSIAGLIQLNRTEEALELMIDETSIEENIVHFLRDHIKHYAVSGLLLGKRSRAKELDVTLTIDETSYLHEIVEGFIPGDIVSMLGNLIDNGIEASVDEETREVICLIQGNSEFLYILVEDKGKGMEQSEQNLIFNEGYSTKAKEGRGIGLALVKEIVEANQGTIHVSSYPQEGTRIEVEVYISRGG